MKRFALAAAFSLAAFSAHAQQALQQGEDPLLQVARLEVQAAKDEQLAHGRVTEMRLQMQVAALQKRIEEMAGQAKPKAPAAPASPPAAPHPAMPAPTAPAPVLKPHSP